jgi:DMSO/TMAO reductase YedYZ molybdopterin-dependent catalytic subunit
VRTPPDRLLRHRRLLGAAAGVLASLTALAAAELVAAFVRPESSPVVAVGSNVVDLTPTWLREWAVGTFGTHDKPVLIASVLAVLLLLAVVTGALAVQHRAVGVVGVCLIGAVGALAAATRPEAETFDAAPSVVGAVVGSVALLRLLRPLPVVARSSDGDGGEPPGVVDERRRQLLVTGLVVAAGSLAAGTLGRVLTARRTSVTASRAAVELPPAASTQPVVAGAELAVPGLGPFRTPNDDFYRIDTSLIVPQVTAEDWRLRVHGMVDTELELTFAQLLARDMVARDITLTCVSNEVGGYLAGNARWLGAPLAALLEEAGVHPDADMLLSRSSDGFTIGTPTSVVMDGRDALLAVGMNGEPLPAKHGFPVRMVVPGLYGYVSATKWLVDLELTRFDRETPYWVQRGWVPKAPILTMSRIDVPGPYSRVRAGTVAVAGVAWAQHRGIDKVEVRVDGGRWSTARLAAVPSTDTWRQWVWEWEAAPGSHELEVRATDSTGAVQPERRTDPFPRGATGWSSTQVSVG